MKSGKETYAGYLSGVSFFNSLPVRPEMNADNDAAYPSDAAPVR